MLMNDIKSLQFELLKNLDKNLFKTNLFLNENSRVLSIDLFIKAINNAFEIADIKESFDINHYIKLKDSILSLANNSYHESYVLCDEINNLACLIGYYFCSASFWTNSIQNLKDDSNKNILTDNLKNIELLKKSNIEKLSKKQIINLIGMLFKIASHLANNLHVMFHYQGSAVYFNKYILYGLIINSNFTSIKNTDDIKNKMQSAIKHARFLFPKIDNDFFIPQIDEKFFHSIDNILITNPYQYIIDNSTKIINSGNIVILENIFKIKYTYISKVFLGYKNAILNANPLLIAKWEKRLHKAIKIIEQICITTNNHHLHFHKTTADIFYNHAICGIITDNLDMAKDSLLKAIDIEKTNAKNQLFQSVFDKIQDVYKLEN